MAVSVYGFAILHWRSILLISIVLTLVGGGCDGGSPSFPSGG